MTEEEAGPAWKLKYRRPSSYVIELYGADYEVLPEDPLYEAVDLAASLGPELPDEPAPAPLEPPAAILTARQIRRWLIYRSIPLAAVDTAIAQLAEPERSVAQVEWEYATLFERANPLVGQIGAAIGLTSGEIDQAFVDAPVMWP